MTDRAACGFLLALLVTSASTYAQQTDTPRQPSVPTVNRASDRLPPWLRVGGEFRERMEGFDGAGFDETREDLYWLSRFRFNVALTPANFLAFQLQLQDARVAKKSVGSTGTPF